MDNKFAADDRLRVDHAHMTGSLSAPRLSFSATDVFNLRNHNLSPMSRSTIGLYSPIRKSGEQINLFGDYQPKSILVKKHDISTSRLSGLTNVTDVIPEETEKDANLAHIKIRKEIQFTVFVVVCFIFMVVIPLSMITIGILHLYNCKAQPMIPIYLIIAGSAFICFMFLFRKLRNLVKDQEHNDSFYSRCLLASILIQVGWFAAGCYWTYAAFPPNYYDTTSLKYCHKTLYQYAFWLLNSIFLSTSLFLISFTVYIVFGRPTNNDVADKA
ncbi:transmembrane protein 272 isoform X2 [Parasteatoda tepidariorum]|uniref:transmembrane protein 272 isoform X2 n=1 Tax=Parasteatoda tepidariorum TaxID=114398 RepID=UPI001C71DF2A|nr:transmembrane protein 272 isoform X2 [Parasteatoda tepidariorum]